MVDDSDVSGPVLSVLQDPVEPNLLWVGGEYGLYVSTNGGGTFQKWDKNDANSTSNVTSPSKREKDLVLGTFGRGAWVLDDVEPLRQLAAANDFSELTFFTPPTAYQWEQAKPWSTICRECHFPARIVLSAQLQGLLARSC